MGLRITTRFPLTRPPEIAQVVFVKGIGVCSYQPLSNGLAPKNYRMMDKAGKYHFVTGDKLFEATEQEQGRYLGQRMKEST